MTSEELTEKIREVVHQATDRMISAGHEQYVTHRGPLGPDAQQVQRYELESLDDEVTGLEEELMDVINWSAMTILKIREAREEEN